MLAHQRSNAEEKSDTELTRINVGDEIHGEAKQTCCSTRMDGTGREGTKATFQEQNARHNDLQGAEADAGSFKTKSSSLRDHNPVRNCARPNPNDQSSSPFSTNDTTTSDELMPQAFSSSSQRRP